MNHNLSLRAGRARGCSLPHTGLWHTRLFRQVFDPMLTLAFLLLRRVKGENRNAYGERIQAADLPEPAPTSAAGLEPTIFTSLGTSRDRHCIASLSDRVHLLPWPIRWSLAVQECRL